MTTTAIAEAIREILADHKRTRDALGHAMAEILTPLPNGVKLQCGPHTITTAKVYCGCSQWSNRTWDLTGKANGYLVDGTLIRDEDPTVWDGNNHHYRKTPLYLDVSMDGPETPTLRMATAKVLHEAAKHLPAAMKAYLDVKIADTAANVAARLEFEAATV